MSMWNQEDDEFFIGYQPPMPPRLARFIRHTVIGIIALVLFAAAAFGGGHARLEGGTFEFGRPHSFGGTIIERPYPTVRLDSADSTAAPMPLLVAPGKYGADALVRGMNGQHVAFTGTRIQRGSHTMIEIEPASLETRPATEQPAGGIVETLEDSVIGPVELAGEIVDSKCFLGVMVPGSGKTHKDCASICLRGGIPPAFSVQDLTGKSALLLLTGPNGEAIAPPALRVAGEALFVRGFVRHQEGWLVLRTDPASWRPFDR
jgi:hypothetical protein